MPSRLLSFENGFAEILCEGDVSSEDIVEVSNEVATLHDSSDPVKMLVEDRNSGFDPSTEALRGMVENWRNVFKDTPIKIAVAVSRDVHFGIGRMLEVFTGDDIQFTVFRDLEEAREWLNANE